MSVLHDHPLLGSAEITAALPGNDLGNQLERIRFSMQPLGVEEIYRLWTGFQTPYRTSVAYEASVVLIDSTRETQAALPVLKRGQTGSGVALQQGVGPAFATITAIAPTVDVTFGDTLTIAGTRLSGQTVSVSFASPRLAQPRSVAVLPGGTDTQVKVIVPVDPAFPAGLYSVCVTTAAPLPDGSVESHTSNEVALTLAPQITSGLPAKVTAANGTVTLTVGCTPNVLAEQRVALLFGDREIAADATATRPAGSLTFTLAGVTPGAYFVRLRVDGADSTLLADRSARVPVFNAARKVTVT
jgi:hypothetical protein